MTRAPATVEKNGIRGARARMWPTAASKRSRSWSAWALWYGIDTRRRVPSIASTSPVSVNERGPLTAASSTPGDSSGENDGDHPAAADERLLQPRAVRRDLERLLERQRARRPGGRDLAEGVPDDRRGRHAAGAPQLRQPDLQRQAGGLRVGGIEHRRAVPLSRAEPGMERGAAVDRRAEDRLGRVQLAAHPHHCAPMPE